MAAVTTPAPQAPAGQAGPDAAAAAGGMVAVQGSPFDLADDDTYRRWRRWKLAHRLVDTAPLWVELADARKLTPDEAAALRLRIGRHGMALYRSPDLQADPGLPRALGAQMGLHRLDANWLADEDGISPIAVAREGHPARGDFIPYTDRAIRWHTDGYYHPQARRIRGMILHCVRPAAEGGETSLLDPELLYIALRDESPALVRALQHPQAMTIPARDDESGVARPAQSGPVFETVQGRLHLRYTARTRSIEWRDDPLTGTAVERLAALLADDRLGVLRTTLQAGSGLVGHNVLHERSAFRDDPAAPRLLYRARYLDRIVSAEEDAWSREGSPAWPNG
jgi:hypothetical protein